MPGKSKVDLISATTFNADRSVWRDHPLPDGSAGFIFDSLRHAEVVCEEILDSTAFRLCVEAHVIDILERYQRTLIRIHIDTDASVTSDLRRQAVVIPVILCRVIHSTLSCPAPERVIISLPLAARQRDSDQLIASVVFVARQSLCMLTQNNTAAMVMMEALAVGLLHLVPCL
jgi:hypothetical protein